MTGELITFPIRLGLRAARAAVRGGLQASERAIALASFVTERVISRGPDEDSDARAAATDTREPTAAGRTTRVAEPSVATSGEVPPPLETEMETEPVHVSAEPTLVEEFAEPGAEDGAGAQVTVAEPWSGYARLNARDVIARAAAANAVELAAMQLYEAAHRRRETVMTAVERELRTKSGRGAATADQTRKEHTNGG